MNITEAVTPIQDVKREEEKEKPPPKFIGHGKEGDSLTLSEINFLLEWIDSVIKEVDKNEKYEYDFVKIEAEVGNFRSKSFRIELGSWKRGEEKQIDFTKVREYDLRGIWVRFIRVDKGRVH